MQLPPLPLLEAGVIVFLILFSYALFKFTIFFKFYPLDTRASVDIFWVL